MSGSGRDEVEVDALRAKLKVEWVPNTGPFDPMEALAELAVNLWLSRKARGNVQAPGPQQAEERREAG